MAFASSLYSRDRLIRDWRALSASSPFVCIRCMFVRDGILVMLAVCCMLMLLKFAVTVAEDTSRFLSIVLYDV